MYYQGGREMTTDQLISAYDREVGRIERLFYYHLAFLRELDHYALTYDADVRNKYLEASRLATEHLVIRNNPIIRAIVDKPELQQGLDRLKVAFNYDAEDNLVQKVFMDLKNSEYYKEYITNLEQPGTHEEFVMHLFKHYGDNFQLFEQHFEEEYPNLQDDKKLVASMIKKTVQNILTGKEPFMVEFVQDWENTMGFGQELLQKVVAHDQELMDMVLKKIHKWEPGQVAVLDNIIIKMGIAEFLYFPSIPSTVTINEYVELAKNYSPPNSKKFVNGVLDTISRELVLQKGTEESAE
jgi:N utilization substance protein B